MERERGSSKALDLQPAVALGWAWPGLRFSRLLRATLAAAGAVLFVVIAGIVVWIAPTPGTDMLARVAPPLAALLLALAVLGYRVSARLVRATRDLESREQHYQTIFNNDTVGVGRCRLSDGRILLANARLARMMGYDSVAALAAGHAFSPDHARPEDRADFAERLRGTRGRAVECGWIRRDGSAIEVLLQAEADEDAGVIDFVMIDVTGWKRAELALQASEERLRQATKLTKVGYYLWDSVADRCVYCSEEFARPFGLGTAELLRRAGSLDAFLEMIHPDDRDTVRQAVIELRCGNASDISYRVLAADGEVRHVREIGKPVFDENGTVVKETGTTQDITDLVTARRALEESEQMLRGVIENAPLSIFLKDLSGVYKLVNLPFLEQRGLSAEQVVGRTDREMAISGAISRDEERLIAGLDSTVRREGRAIACEFERTSPEGVQRLISSVKFPVTDLGGRITGIGGIGQDVTDQRRAQAEFLQAQKIRAVGQLTGGVAHDFNNLLGVIQVSAEMLRRGVAAGTGEVDRALVDTILGAAARGATLTQRLLAFSRLQPLNPRTTDLARLVAAAPDVIARSLGGAVAVETESAEGLWPVHVDAGQVEIALLNLAFNARDAMPGGGALHIVCRNARVEAADGLSDLGGEPIAGDYVALSVTDRGHGMTAEVLARAVEPFFTTREVGQGSGLGLSMVYGFAKQSGGHMTIDSAPGRGTAVTLYLKRDGDAAPGAAVRDRPAKQKARAGAQA